MPGDTRQREQALQNQGFQHIAGVDEAGRGPLAGPVFAAACVISPEFYHPTVTDSKKLTPARRDALYGELTQSEHVHYGIGQASVEEIDSINILQATLLAMRRAVAALPVLPDYVLVDGVHLDLGSIPCEKVIRGDLLVYCIGGASILAKVARDRLMQTYHEQWSQYGFNRHKGYGTVAHLRAIEEHGPCPIHRRSFEPIKKYVIMES